MKKLFYFVSVALATFAMVSCSSKPEEPEVPEPTFELPKYTNDLYDEPYLGFGASADTVDYAMKYFGFEQDTTKMVEDVIVKYYKPTKQALLYAATIDTEDGLIAQSVIFDPEQVDADALKAALTDKMKYEYVGQRNDEATNVPSLYYISEEEDVLAILTVMQLGSGVVYYLEFQEYEYPSVDVSEPKYIKSFRAMPSSYKF